MGKILGLDLGTNSIGWAVVEKVDGQFNLLDEGVRIFQEGVKIEKGQESSKAAERTGFRSARKLKYRRRLRKIATLRVLSNNGFCPELSLEELKLWRNKKIYPDNNSFMEWQKTSEEDGINPYAYRALAVEKTLDLSVKENRYIIGRAFYHMAQRRGFKSNRLETTKESDGTVHAGISEINEKKGELTLGQYFNELYKKGEKIRDHYTDREQHYLEEFNRICAIQKIPEKMIKDLHNAIFFQRPLKSQKGLVGRCPFEKNKFRCPVSHPLFEEYRMLSLINSIKINAPDEDKLRFISKSEKEAIHDLFFRSSKTHFEFEEIAKRLTPKGFKYGFSKDRTVSKEAYKFNYPMKTPVTGCQTISQLKKLFGKNYAHEIASRYKLSKGKDEDQILQDVWHVLFTFGKEDKLIEFAKNRLVLSDDEAKKFAGIRLKKEYAALSLKALRNVLPYLRQGELYSHAIFMANMHKVVPEQIWNNPKKRESISIEVRKIIETQNEEKQLNNIVNGLIEDCQRNNVTYSENEHWQDSIKRELSGKLKSQYGNKTWDSFDNDLKYFLSDQILTRFYSRMKLNGWKGEHIKTPSIAERINDFLRKEYSIQDSKLDKLYHPSAVEVYKKAEKSKDGKYYLGSPIISSIRNPMAMRALHQLKKVVNQLIEDDVIDENTRVQIEMSRELNDSNKRQAIQRWQNNNFKKHQEFRKKIREHLISQGKNSEPTPADILRYQLWEEQNHICLYTGENIGLFEFLGPNPKYDIEHTIPRSVSLDNSQVNVTLCQSHFNRNVKENRIPFELDNHNQILKRITHWYEMVDKLDKLIAAEARRSKAATDKEGKDSHIQRRHELTLECNYWKQKIKTFEMTEVTDGFKNSQIVDTGIINKYGRLYLKTVFDKVFTVKGSTVADFRKFWGLQEEYEKKERTNHIHHCIDAVVIACMTKEAYENLARFYHEWEEFEQVKKADKPDFPKPWDTFTEDVKKLENEVLISHYTPDNLPKQAKKKLRIKGIIQYNKKGEPIYQKGDTVRGGLHQAGIYGAIKQNEEIVHVKRKPLKYNAQNSDGFSKFTELDKIIDEAVREKVKEQINEAIQNGSIFKEAIEQTIWMNKEKNIPINKVRCKTNVKSPLKWDKQNRDYNQNRLHKHMVNVVNEGNYLLAIYEGKDKNGNVKRDFELINRLDAGSYYKRSNDQKKYYPIIPDQLNNSSSKLCFTLKIGTQIILYQSNKDEIKELTPEELSRRLYRVVGIKTNKVKSGNKKYFFGMVVLRHHQEARKASDLKTLDGAFNPKESYMAQRKLSHNQFFAMVEGLDFVISPTGKIQMKK